VNGEKTMFKEKIREILELVLEVEEKTNACLSFDYSTDTKDICVHVAGHVFIAADNKYMEEDIQEIKDYLKALIKGGEA
jgi:hypothetical protein